MCVCGCVCVWNLGNSAQIRLGFFGRRECAPSELGRHHALEMAGTFAKLSSRRASSFAAGMFSLASMSKSMSICAQIHVHVQCTRECGSGTHMYTYTNYIERLLKYSRRLLFGEPLASMSHRIRWHACKWCPVCSGESSNPLG